MQVYRTGYHNAVQMYSNGYFSPECLLEHGRGSLIERHLVVEADDVVLGAGLSRQRVVGPTHLDKARI